MATKDHTYKARETSDNPPQYPNAQDTPPPRSHSWGPSNVSPVRQVDSSFKPPRWKMLGILSSGEGVSTVLPLSGLLYGENLASFLLGEKSSHTTPFQTCREMVTPKQLFPLLGRKISWSSPYSLLVPVLRRGLHS